MLVSQCHVLHPILHKTRKHLSWRRHGSWSSHSQAGTSCTTTAVSVRATHSPCVLITAPDGCDSCSVQSLAAEVRQQLGVQALVVLPAQPPTDNNSLSSSRHNSNTAAAAASLSFEQQLHLLPSPNDHLTFGLSGATAADCVLCAVDQTCGLMQSLGLSPVLVLVGVTRNPALSSDMDQHPAVAVARQAAILGLPAVAACLATTSAGAPTQPAITATVRLLAKLLPVLQGTAAASRSSRTAARNFPRAHFPFPEEGRWALGTQLPLPSSGGLAGAAGSGTWSRPYDSWALGDDNSWLGHYNSNQRRQQQQHQQEEEGSNAAVATRLRAYQALQAAFADGDVLVCLNVPPTWTEAAGFAATRPGVLWHCWQVEGTGHVMSSGSSSSSRSWQSTADDLFGRTLPSTSYGSHIPMGDNFVAQDNTRKVAAVTRQQQQQQQQQHEFAFNSRGQGLDTAEQQVSVGRLAHEELPMSFRVRRGTMLNDAAACGDVEAVLNGRGSVTVCQTWPAAHPLSCTDELLLAALDQGQDQEGLPAWVTTHIAAL